MIRLKRYSSILLAVLTLVVGPAMAQQKQPNVVFILADNVGYGDMGPYGGGELRGMPTPRTEELARNRADGQHHAHQANKDRDVGGRTDRERGQIVGGEARYQDRVHRAEPQHRQLPYQHRPGHRQDARKTVAQQGEVTGMYVSDGAWLHAATNGLG